MKPYDKCPGCKKWCDICYIAMKPKPGKQLKLLFTQNTNYNDGNNKFYIQQDSGAQRAIKKD